MLIRWLGAYGRGNSLHDSLNWELNQTERSELCAEPLSHNGGISTVHARIGLVVKRTALVRKFNGDCWSIHSTPSEPGGETCLVKTRNPRKSTLHGEAWVKPQYVAIAVKNWGSIAAHHRKTVAWFSKHHGLKVIDINNHNKDVITA